MTDIGSRKHHDVSMSLRAGHGNAALIAELAVLREDVNSLASELLNQYEEITLLYDLTRDLGVVLDLGAASEIALVRSLEVIPATFGVVLVGDSPDDLTTVASSGGTEPNDRLRLLAGEAARMAIVNGSQVMVHAGGFLHEGGGPVDGPVLAAPLLASNAATVGGAAGALVFAGHGDADRFSAAEAQLCAVVARQLAQGIENARLIGQLREKERLESELELAADIQRSLLPKRAPEVVGATFAARCLPAAQVGGDFYDYVAGPGGMIHAVVADVVGHGLGPGLIMAMTRSVLRAELRSKESLADAVTATNAVMWDDLVATEAFITLFAVRYDPRSRRLSFVNGGHHPAMLRHRNGEITDLSSDGMPFGLLPMPPYEERARYLAPGEIVLIFSDGVIESCAPDGAEFGSMRLRALVAEAGGGSAEALVERVVADLTSFHGPGPQEDDITLLALCVTDDDCRHKVSSAI
jgi:serine phosphatase RsbU (regulator of sigma subunit)